MLTKAFVTTGVLQVLVPRYCVTSPSPSSCRKGRWCFLHKPHQQLPPGQPMDHGDTVVDAVGERCMWCPSCKKSTKPWWGPKCGNAKRLNQLVTYDFFSDWRSMDASLFYLVVYGRGLKLLGFLGYHEFFPIISIHLLFWLPVLEFPRLSTWHYLRPKPIWGWQEWRLPCITMER